MEMAKSGYFKNMAFRHRGTEGRSLVWLTGTLLIAALWMASRPYEGAIGDARLYAVEALRLLLPGHFDDDLYFRSGSQGQFTLFPRIYAPFLAYFGVGGAALRLTVVFQAAWVGGLAFFVFSLFRDNRERFLAIAAVIIFPHRIFFAYGESFLTPRLAAEALTLWGLGFMVRERIIWTIVCLAVGMLLHPLMTLPAVACVALRQTLRRPLLWWLWGVLVAAILVAAGAGIQPFVRLFQRFDPAWFTVVSIRDQFCLPTQWDVLLWMQWINALTTTILAFIAVSVRERRLLLELIGVVAGLFVLTVVCGDVLRDVLVVDIQQYRAVWLLELVSNMFIGGFSLRWPWREFSSLTRLFLVGAFVMLYVAGITDVAGVVTFASAPMAALAAAAAWWERRHGRELPALMRGCGAIIFGVCLGIFFSIAFLLWEYKNNLNKIDTFEWKIFLSIILAGMSFGFVLFIHRLHGKFFVPVAAVVLIMVAIGIFRWDRRDPWTSFVESSAVQSRSLTQLLPEDGQIYWEGDMRIPWFLLSRASYFSCTQGSGVLFNRETAIDYQRRFDTISALETLDFHEDSFCSLPADQKPVPLTRALLRQVCRENPPLSALVLITAVADAPGTVWRAPVPFTGMVMARGKPQPFSVNTFHIYACRDQ